MGCDTACKEPRKTKSEVENSLYGTVLWALLTGRQYPPNTFWAIYVQKLKIAGPLWLGTVTFYKNPSSLLTLPGVREYKLVFVARRKLQEYPEVYAHIHFQAPFITTDESTYGMSILSVVYVVTPCTAFLGGHNLQDLIIHMRSTTTTNMKAVTFPEWGLSVYYAQRAVELTFFVILLN